jgi:AIPR protein
LTTPAQPLPNEVLLLDQRLKQAQITTYPELTIQEYFLINSVDTILRRRGLSSRQIEDGIVDGSDDGGIDAVYLFVNGQLVEDTAEPSASDNVEIDLEVIQAKYESGFREVAIQRLLDHLPILLSLDESVRHEVEFNPRVLERFELFRLTYLAAASRFPKLRISVRYATKAHDAPNEKVQVKARRLAAKITQMFSDVTVDVDLLGAKDLNAKARQRRSTTSTLHISEGRISAEKGGLVCLVNLRDYFAFITDDEGRLNDEIFEENVRDYEGATIINRGIADSLRQGDTATSDFWWLNNGVTVIGRRVGPTGKRLEIEDPQIVNGLQTSRGIYQYFQALAADARGNSEKRDEGRMRQVLVRVIGTTDEEVAAHVIKATNSQNRVSAASLRSAEPFQRSIEEYFLSQDLFYERKKNHYKNLGRPRVKTVEVLELAQAVGSVLLQSPHVARGTPSALVRGKLYERVFSPSTPLAAYYKCFMIMRAVDAFLLLQTDVSGRHERSNIRFHLARAASAFALTSSRPRPRAVADLDLAVLADESFMRAVLDWTLDLRTRAAEVTGVADPGNLAKQSEWATQIDKQLSKYTDKVRWPKRVLSPSSATGARL